MTDRIEPSRSTVAFTARGHADVRATHDKTLEVVGGPHITVRATCVVGVSAELPLPDLQAFRGPIVIDIEAGGVSDRVTAVANPYYAVGDRAVIRRSDHRSPETFATRADKGAADLDRDLVRFLSDPDTEVHVTVSAANVPAIAAAELLVLPGLPAGGGDADIDRRLGTSALVVDGGGLDFHEEALTELPVAGGDEAPQAAWEVFEQGGVVALVGDPGASAPAREVLRTAAAALVPIHPLGLADARMVALLMTGIAPVRCALLGAPPAAATDRGRETAAVARLRAAAAWDGMADALVVLASEAAVSWGDVHAGLLLAPGTPDETHVVGPLADIGEAAAPHVRPHARGVLVVDFGDGRGVEERDPGVPDDADDPAVVAVVDALLAEGVSARTLADALAALPGVAHRRAYDVVHARKRALGETGRTTGRD